MVADSQVKIQGLDFSFDDELLTSWGGTDDCKLVIWRTKTGQVLFLKSHDNIYLCALKKISNPSSIRFLQVKPSAEVQPLSITQSLPNGPILLATLSSQQQT